MTAATYLPTSDQLATAALLNGPGSSNTVQFPPLCVGVGKTVEQCRQAMVNTEVAW